MSRRLFAVSCLAAALLAPAAPAKIRAARRIVNETGRIGRVKGRRQGGGRLRRSEPRMLGGTPRTPRVANQATGVRGGGFLGGGLNNGAFYSGGFRRTGFGGNGFPGGVLPGVFVPNAVQGGSGRVFGQSAPVSSAAGIGRAVFGARISTPVSAPVSSARGASVGPRSTIEASLQRTRNASRREDPSLARFRQARERFQRRYDL